MDRGLKTSAQTDAQKVHAMEPGQEGLAPGIGEVVAPAALNREVLATRIGELQSIAKNVALDADLEVKLGQQGGGSYCAYGRPSSVRMSRGDRSITIDPNHLLDPRGDFIVAHEGAHAHTTFDRDLNKAIRTVCDPEKLHAEIGVGALTNYLADSGINSWLFQSYPGFKDSGKGLYDEMLRVENPTMATPEISAVMAQIGFFPRFGQFGSEIMKKWWTGAYSTKVDPAVVQALNQHEAHIERYLSTFAPGQIAELRVRQRIG